MISRVPLEKSFLVTSVFLALRIEKNRHAPFRQRLLISIDRADAHLAFLSQVGKGHAISLGNYTENMHNADDAL